MGLLNEETPIFEEVREEFDFNVEVSLAYEATAHEDMLRDSYRLVENKR